jgi:hypothetical protein
MSGDNTRKLFLPFLYIYIYVFVHVIGQSVCTCHMYVFLHATPSFRWALGITQIQNTCTFRLPRHSCFFFVAVAIAKY